MANRLPLKRDVLIAFEFAHVRDDFVTPLEEALAGVTAEEAFWRPGPDEMSIWHIVLHMAVWTENCVIRIRSGKHSHPPEGAWPKPPENPSAGAWEEARSRLRTAVESLRAEIEATSSPALLACSVETWSPLIEILGRLIHNAYHIGQITKMRELRFG